MHHRQLIVRPSLVVLCAVFAVGCAATPPREAIPQESKVGSPPIIFAGSYDVERTKLTITANEQPVMRGTFPPFTPVLNLNSTFDGQAIRAECYFSSVLSESGGLVGINPARSACRATGQAHRVRR